MNILYFIIYSIAVWRLTYMILVEDGPYGIFAKIQAWAWKNRKATKVGTFKQGLTCFYCLSIWVAIPFAFLLTGLTFSLLPTILSLSAVAILLDHIHTKLTKQ